MRIIVHIWPVSCNETVLENYAFLVYVYYTHPGYQTSICGKNRAYYIWIFMVHLRTRHGLSSEPSTKVLCRPNFLKMGIKYLKFVVCWTISTIKDEKSAEKFHYIKTVSCSAINCLSSGINILAGGRSVPLISERKGTDPHWKHLRCTHFAS